MHIQVLLGTYNLGVTSSCSPCVPRTMPNEPVLVRDDGAKDDTPERLDRWRAVLLEVAWRSCPTQASVTSAPREISSVFSPRAPPRTSCSPTAITCGSA